MLYHTHVAGGVAAAAGVALLLSTPEREVLPLVLLAAAGALLPDLDTPQSRPAQILALIEGAALGGAAGYYFSGHNLLWASGGLLVGAALGGLGVLAFLALLFLAPAAWKLPGLALLAGLALAGLALHRRSGRWSLISAVLGKVAGHRGPTHSLPFWAGALLAGWLLQHFSVLPFACPWWALGLGYASHLVLDSCTAGGVPWLWPLKQKRVTLLALKTGGWVEHVVVLPLLLVSAAAAVLRLGGIV